MKNVNRILFFFLITSFSSVFGQSASDKLKDEQARLEKKISNTKTLLSQSKNNTAQSLTELQLIDNQIVYREELVLNYDNQVRNAEVKMVEKQADIIDLQEKIKELKEQYKKLLLYAYKHRNKYGKMMYIFSATSYNEAIKRAEYLERIADLEKKQFQIIVQNQSLIQDEISFIEKEKIYKAQLLNQKISEKASIEADKLAQELAYQKFRTEESVLISQLKEEERKRDDLSRKITQAIQDEILAEEKKRKKKEDEAAKKKSSSNTSSSNSSNTAATTTTKKETPTSGSSTTSSTVKKEVVLTPTKEAVSLGKNFESNKGKLPWPVESGTITESFGKNAHPTLSNVYTNNNGVDISASLNASVRAVFEGEVTSVLNIPGAGKVVIIKHGNYRTAYSNLSETSVSAGDIVTTKQVIGSLISKDGSTLSLSHFEIHLVSDSGIQCLNPSLWLKQ
jgi:murein DD-endopeptidase MepM/ murein hydrolase activator NlpD